MSKIIVSGASGQLGLSFDKIRNLWPEYEFFFFDRQSLDIRNENRLKEVIKSIKPDFFINCAAYTAVDKAEEEKDFCFDINSNGPKLIAKTLKEYGGTLIHYSSDYVYHNGMTSPMSETAETSPAGVYAASKLAGEHEVIASNIPAIIIRTSWIYSEFGHNFLKTMLRLGKERSTLSVVNDQIGAPTYAPDLAQVTMKIIAEFNARLEKLHGPEIFNYASEGQVSWFDFARFIFDVSGLSVDVSPIPTSAYPTPAKRPFWSMMNLTKIKKVFGIAPLYWKIGVEDCINALTNNSSIPSNNN